MTGQPNRAYSIGLNFNEAYATTQEQPHIYDEIKPVDEPLYTEIHQ